MPRTNRFARIIALIFSLALTLPAIFSCGEQARPSDFSFAQLADAMEKAESLGEMALVSETTATVNYKKDSLKKYNIETKQIADVKIKRADDGSIVEYGGTYHLTTGDDSESYAVYYADGYAYFDEDGRLYKTPFDMDDMPTGDGFFLFFEEDDVDDYRATEKGGVITVTFTVSWKSASPKIVSLYAALADAISSTGIPFKDVTYEDMKATFQIDAADGSLIGYSYTYTAKMKANDKDTEVKGKTSCRLTADSDVQITAPDLDNYQ